MHFFHFVKYLELNCFSTVHANRAKYDAYKGLGKMPRERAMELYVEELKKIIETMSYTDNVAEFMDSVSELDGVDVDDLEAVAPEAIKKVRSQPNSPFGNETHFNIYFTNVEIIAHTNKYALFLHPLRFTCAQHHGSRVRSELDFGMASKTVLSIPMDIPTETVYIYKMVIPMLLNIPTMNTSILWR